MEMQYGSPGAGISTQLITAFKLQASDPAYSIGAFNCVIERTRCWDIFHKGKRQSICILRMSLVDFICGRLGADGASDLVVSLEELTDDVRSHKFRSLVMRIVCDIVCYWEHAVQAEKMNECIVSRR
jgi:hypothetical protein